SASAGGSSRLHLREYLNGVRVGASGYFSNSAKLSPSWTLLYEDYVAQSTGSTLDLQVEDVPLAFTEVFQVDNLSIRIVSSTPSAPALASQDPEAGSRLQAWSTAIEPVLDLGASDPLWKVRFGATSSAPAERAARFTRFALVYRGREVAACQATPLQESADPEAPDLARMAGHAGPEASGAAPEITEVTFDRAELRKLFAGLAAGGRQSLTVE